jgi:hypothetical protein
MHPDIARSNLSSGATGFIRAKLLLGVHVFLASCAFDNTSLRGTPFYVQSTLFCTATHSDHWRIYVLYGQLEKFGTGVAQAFGGIFVNVQETLGFWIDDED